MRGLLVPELLKKSLNEVAGSSAVSERYKPLGKKHERFVERVREKSEVQGRVVFVDLTDSMLESVGSVTIRLRAASAIAGISVNRLRVTTVNRSSISCGKRAFEHQSVYILGQTAVRPLDFSTA